MPKLSWWSNNEICSALIHTRLLDVHSTRIRWKLLFLSIRTWVTVAVDAEVCQSYVQLSVLCNVVLYSHILLVRHTERWIVCQWAIVSFVQASWVRRESSLKDQTLPGWAFSEICRRMSRKKRFFVTYLRIKRELFQLHFHKKGAMLLYAGKWVDNVCWYNEKIAVTCLAYGLFFRH